MKTHYPSNGMSEDRFKEIVVNFFKVVKLNPDIQRQYLWNISQSMTFEEQKELYRFCAVLHSHLIDEVFR